MAELVLDNNLLEFNGKQYIQKDGTATGSRLGQKYMGEWENQLLNKHECKHFMFLHYQVMWVIL